MMHLQQIKNMVLSIPIHHPHSTGKEDVMVCIDVKGTRSLPHHNLKLIQHANIVIAYDEESDRGVYIKHRYLDIQSEHMPSISGRDYRYIASGADITFNDPREIDFEQISRVGFEKFREYVNMEMAHKIMEQSLLEHPLPDIRLSNNIGGVRIDEL